MTFTELRTDIMDRLNLSSTDASTRIGRAINRTYRKATTAIGLQLSRRTTTSEETTIGSSLLVFSGSEKVIDVWNRNVTPYRKLKQVTLDELRERTPYPASDTVSYWASHSHTSDSVTIEIDCRPLTEFDLFADIHTAIADLSGTDEPAFPESFHDIIIEGVMMDEYRKLEKLQLAQLSQREYEKILSDLRMWIAKGGPEIWQAKTEASVAKTSGGSSSPQVPDSLMAVSVDPASPADGEVWVLLTGVSPTREASLKINDGGTTRTIASITY